MHKLAFLIPSFLLMTACDKLPFNKEKKENIASVASAATSNNLEAAINTVKNPCLDKNLIQSTKQGILDKAKKTLSKEMSERKINIDIAQTEKLIDTATLTFDDISTPEINNQNPQDSNWCNAKVIISYNKDNIAEISQNLKKFTGNFPVSIKTTDNGFESGIKYRQTKSYTENGSSKIGWEAIWGELPDYIAAYAMMDSFMQNKEYSAKFDTLLDDSEPKAISDNMLPDIKSQNLAEEQEKWLVKQNEIADKIDKDIADEQKKKNSNGYVTQVMEIIDSNWNIPNNSNGNSLAASFKVADDGKISDITMKGNANKAFKASLEQAIKQSSPLPPPPNGARTITGNFKVD